MNKKADATICPLPWNHFSVSLDTSMRICCNTHNGGRILNDEGERFPLSDISSLEQYYNTPFFKNIRRQMINGERPEHCSNCFAIEDNGGQSLRQIYSEKYFQDLNFQQQMQATKADGSINPHVTYLDFSLGNKCNLKCVMCNPHSSSNLKNDFRELNWSVDTTFLKDVEEGWLEEDVLLKKIEMCLPTVKEMLFTGGEPLLSNLHHRILESIVKQGGSQEITLRYHSNFTHLPQRLLEIWTHFKNVELHASIDGFGEVNDYIRYGSDFSMIEKHLLKAADLENIRIEVHSCLEIPSIFGLPKLYQWLNNLHPRIPPLPYHIMVTQPAWLDVSHLPFELKTKARKEIENYLERSSSPSSFHETWWKDKTLQIKALLNRMDAAEQNPALWHEFKRNISSLEDLRGNRLKHLVPELFL